MLMKTLIRLADSMLKNKSVDEANIDQANHIAYLCLISFYSLPIDYIYIR